MDFSLDIICSIDENGNFVTVSAASEKIWGYKPAELEGKRYMDLVVEEDHELTNDAAANIMNGNDTTNFENRYRCKNGDVIPIVWSARWNSEEKMMYCVARDAREKKKVEQEIRDRKRQLVDTITELKETNRQLALVNEFRFLSDIIPQIIWTSKPDGNLDYFNKKWYEYTGLAFEQTKDSGWETVIHPDDLQNCINKWTNSFKTGEDYEVEYRLKSADNLYRWHLGRAKPMFNEKGEIVKWFGTCTDIHDTKLMHEELEKNNEELTRFREIAIEEVQKKSQLLNGMLKNLPVIIYRIDADGIITDIMGAGLKLIGLKEGELVGINALDTYSHLPDILNKLHTGESNVYERWKHFEGKDYCFEIYLFNDEVNPGFLGLA
ncbi:MAG: PAS domain S-box protein [Chitinophagaceae bacterium]|nr:PAS domain S-box protein [Chitinophagaceae bacterium]